MALSDAAATTACAHGLAVPSLRHTFFIDAITPRLPIHGAGIDDTWIAAG